MDQNLIIRSINLQTLYLVPTEAYFIPRGTGRHLKLNFLKLSAIMAFVSGLGVIQVRTASIPSNNVCTRRAEYTSGQRKTGIGSLKCGVSPGGPGDRDDSLLRDAQRFRATRKRKEGDESKASEKNGLQAVIETVLVWDFFAICVLLAWLALAIVLHYSSSNDVLLDPWLSIWPNVTQPLLGILMLAAISQGAFSFFNKKESGR